MNESDFVYKTAFDCGVCVDPTDTLSLATITTDKAIAFADDLIAKLENFKTKLQEEK